MSKTLEKMQEQIEALLKALNTFNIPVFEDGLAEDEEAQFEKKGYHFFVYETGNMFKNDDLKTIKQEIVVYYYSENRDDLDERTIEIIQALSKVPIIKFERSQKQQLRRKDTDNYVDRIVLLYNRKIVTGCAEI
ncbi:hypothetical protein ACIQXW_11205 [Lysinibacillus sp. NPDC097162]|uniref:hypothetical protein n=1 Tax=Lysinibacillus sp. NPDC097162 TaxID=3364140 RepID=UPI00381ADA99